MVAVLHTKVVNCIGIVCRLHVHRGCHAPFQRSHGYQWLSSGDLTDSEMDPIVYDDLYSLGIKLIVRVKFGVHSVYSR